MDKYNWVLFSYNGNETVCRLIIGATTDQVMFLIDSEGNADDGDEWSIPGGLTSCQLVCIGRHDWESTLQQIVLDHIVMWFGTDGETSSRIADLPCWIVDYSEYPEGKIVRQMKVDVLESIAEMELEAEREDPEYINGRSAF